MLAESTRLLHPARPTAGKDGQSIAMEKLNLMVVENLVERLSQPERLKVIIGRSETSNRTRR